MTSPSPSASAAGQPPGAPTLPETSPHEPAVRPWELELLISGAVVFSLLQVPSHVDDWFAHLAPHVAERTHLGVFMLYTYVKLILYTLITCFVLHLIMRAYWVGLIGLESVFPQGVRWEDSSYGPVMTEVYRERMGRLQEKIDAADRFCSILFPLAFTVVMLFFFSIALLALGSGLAFGISRLLFDGQHLDRILIAIIVVLMLIPMGTWLLDLRFGARVERGGPGYRFLRRASLASYYVNALPIYGVTFMTLLSNVRKRARYPAMYALMAVLFGFFFLKDIFLAQGVVASGEHFYLPDEPGAFGVGPGFYESQREEGEIYDRLPSIQSDVVREPYVKLFIPYAPLRHGEAFAQRCPGVRPLSRGGVRLDLADPPDSAAVRAVLDCWTRLQPVTLNGRPIRPDFRFYTHPGSGIRGILAYIPVQGLPRGENVLTVGVPPRTAQAESRRRRVAGDRQQAEPYHIPFWLGPPSTPRSIRRVRQSRIPPLRPFRRWAAADRGSPPC